jgi:hypothetical protein
VRSAVSVVGYVNLGLYVLAGLAAIRLSVRVANRAARWAAATFGVLTLVVVIGQLLPAHPHGLQTWAVRVLVALLVVFPYLLFRFTTLFETATGRLQRLIGLLTAAMVVWTFALPRFPSQGQPRPTSFWLFVAGFVVHGRC